MSGLHPRAFVLASTDHGTMIVNRNDYHMLASGMAYGVGWQLLNYGCFDPGELAVILSALKERRELVGDGLVALDCGANIGVHTLEMARYMVGWGNVTAFEPQERLFYALCGNIALANLENASAVLAAVGAEDTEISVPYPNYNKPGSYGSVELRYTENTEYIGQSINYNRTWNKVRLLTVDGLKLNRVDFIKLDIEGMELEALEGARETIKQFRPTLLVEFIKTDRTKLETVLTDLGYEWTELGGNLLATTKH